MKQCFVALLMAMFLPQLVPNTADPSVLALRNNSTTQHGGAQRRPRRCRRRAGRRRRIRPSLLSGLSRAVRRMPTWTILLAPSICKIRHANTRVKRHPTTTLARVVIVRQHASQLSARRLTRPKLRRKMNRDTELELFRDDVSN